MTWFKIDDTLWGHPKWISTSAAARALWVTAGSWSAGQLTDGNIPRHVLPMLGGRPRDAAELVEHGLWDATDTGWTFHDWDEYQPTRADVEEKRRYERERKREYRRDKGGKYSGRPARSPDGTPNGTTAGSPTSPSRPVLIPPTPLRGQHPPARTGSAADAAGETTPTFDDFWAAYPRKKDQAAARTAWHSAIRHGTPPESILAGLQAHLPDLEAKDEQYRPYPARWLRDARWGDDPDRGVSPPSLFQQLPRIDQPPA